jgi:hypothetical protein
MAGYSSEDRSGQGAPVPAIEAELERDHPINRIQIERVIARHGVWVVYIRAHEGFPCTRCRPGATTPGTEGDGDCPECFGLGFQARLERTKAVIAKGRRTLPQESDTPVGQFNDSKFRAYFPVEFHPEKSDMFLEVEWNVKSPSKFAGEPKRILHVYSLDSVEPFYAQGSAVFCVCKIDTFDHHLAPITKALAAVRR